MRLAAAVLAAGESRRMGRQKLLLPLGNATMLRRVVSRVCDADVGDVIVVLGPEPGLLESELGGLPCRAVWNPRFNEGMGTSFAAAVDALSNRIDGALFVLADQPFVTTAMLNALLQAFRDGAPPVVFARFDEVIAPPHVIHRDLFPDLRHCGPHGAKSVLRPHFARSAIVDLPAEGLIDVDDEESYRRATALVAAEA